MSAVRQHEDDIHFRTKINKVAWSLAACVPEETARCIDGDGRNEGADETIEWTRAYLLLVPLGLVNYLSPIL